MLRSGIPNSLIKIKGNDEDEGKKKDKQTLKIMEL